MVHCWFGSSVRSINTRKVLAVVAGLGVVGEGRYIVWHIVVGAEQLEKAAVEAASSEQKWKRERERES